LKCQKFDQGWLACQLPVLKCDGRSKRERLHTGSKIPAPGQTISKSPNSSNTVSNAARNCFQSVTFVSLKTTLPVSGSPSLEPMSSLASAVSFKSAITILQLCETRSFENARQIPEPPPVTSAVLLRTGDAILFRGESALVSVLEVLNSRTVLKCSAYPCVTLNLKFPIIS
jgi:hypothetical protein